MLVLVASREHSVKHHQVTLLTCQTKRVLLLIVVPCAATPCENGGVCELTGVNTYGCRCPAQYTGIRCETYILGE